MPRNTASNSRARSSNAMSRPISHLQAKFDAHVLHDLAALLHHLFLELERRYAEGQQAADLRIAVEHHGRHAVARQHIRACQARRVRRPRPRRACRCAPRRHVGLPAPLERLVRDVLFDGADAHRADAVVQRARALAQPVLRTDAPAHLGQRIGLMRELRRLEQLARLDQREPIRNVVVHRAFPLAEGIAAGRGTAPPAARPPRRCTAHRSRGTPWCAPRRGACPDRGAGCRETAGACRPWRRVAAITRRGADWQAASRSPPLSASPPRTGRCRCGNRSGSACPRRCRWPRRAAR